MFTLERNAMSDGSPDFMNLIGNAANIVGLITGSEQLIQMILPFVTGTSTDTADQVNQRIDLLQSNLNQQIAAVGDQIKQQIQDLDNISNQQVVLDLLTRAKTAESLLHDYYVATDAATKGPLLSQADQYATYVSEYVQQVSNLAYLPALALGGAVRLDIIRVLNAQFRSDPVYSGEIGALINLLQQQISAITTAVTNSHAVGSGRQILETITTPLGKPQVIWGYYMTHTSHGAVMQTFPYGYSWVAYDNASTSFTQAQATASAQQAVSQGTTDELNFLGVPTLNTTLTAWEKFLAG